MAQPVNPYSLQSLSIAFEADEPQAIREWGAWFEEYFRQHQLDLCAQLLNEVKRQYDALCPACRARIRLAEGELCQKQHVPDKARRCYQDSLTLQKRVVRLLQRRLVRYEKKAVQPVARTGHPVERASFQTLLEIHKAEMAQCLHQLGKLDFEQRHYKSAARQYQRAVEVWRDLHRPAGLVLSLIGLGEVYRVLPEYTLAEAYLKEALARAEDTADDAHRADAQHHLGLLWVQRGEVAKAYSCFEASWALAKQLRDQARIADSRHQLGLLAQAKGRYREALQHYRVASTSAQKLHDQVGAAAFYHQRGMLYQAQGNFKQAAEQYDQALRWWQQLDELPREAQTRHQLGLLAHTQGDHATAQKYHATAEEYYQTSLQIAQQLDDKAGQAWTLYQLGVLYQGRDDTRSQKYYRASRDAARAVRDWPMQARTWYQLGVIQQKQLHYAQARYHYERALALQQHRDPLGEAQTLYQLGLLDQFEQQYTQAQGRYEACLAIERQLGDPAAVAATLYQLGTLHQAPGVLDLDAARRHFAEALGLWQVSGHLGRIALTHYQLGMICQQQGKEGAQASQHFQDTLAAARKLKPKDWMAIASAHYQLGMICRRQENGAQASQHFRDTLAAARKLPSQEWMAVARQELGTTHRLNGTFDHARRQYQAALRLYRTLNDPRGVTTVLYLIGLSYEEQGNCRAAYWEYEAARARAQKSGDQAGMTYIRQTLVHLQQQCQTR